MVGSDCFRYVGGSRGGGRERKEKKKKESVDVVKEEKTEVAVKEEVSRGAKR